MKMNKTITREYRGYEIVREDNPQWRCALNYSPNAMYVYIVLKDGVKVGEFDKLKYAKQHVDSTLHVFTKEELERVERFTASLNNETVVA